MSPIPSPPPGYTCEIKGFDNVPTRAPDTMPGGNFKTTLADFVTDHSNTVKVPFYGPNVPKGM